MTVSAKPGCAYMTFRTQNAGACCNLTAKVVEKFSYPVILYAWGGAEIR